MFQITQVKNYDLSCNEDGWQAATCLLMKFNRNADGYLQDVNMIIHITDIDSTCQDIPCSMPVWCLLNTDLEPYP
jgi:hypothetical protein